MNFTVENKPSQLGITFYCFVYVICTNFSSFSFFTRIEYQSAIRTSCRSVLWHGLNSAQLGGRCSWSVAEKTGSMYPCRRWSLGTLVVTRYLPDIPFVTHHNRFFSESPTSGGMQHTFSQIKSCAFYKVMRWHFSGVVDKGVTVCFLLR